MSIAKKLVKDYFDVFRDLIQLRKEPSMATSKKCRVRQVNEDEVRILAYLKWEQNGEQKSSEEYWLEAEKELLQQTAKNEDK